MAETQARFTGTVSFPSQEDARAFRDTLNQFIDSSSRVFFEIEKAPMFHLTLLGEAKALLNASENFELNAIHFQFPESRARCAGAFKELSSFVSDLERVLLEPRPHVQRWSLGQAERISLAVKGVLGCVKNLLDFNENDVIVVVSQNIATCHKAADALEKATSHVPKHKSNLTVVTDALKDQLENRASVVTNASVREALLSVRRRIEPAIENAMNRGTTNDFAELRKLLDEASKLFVPQFSEGDFSYKDVDNRAFNSAIDDLLSSIKRGDGGGIRDNAGRLGAQAKSLNDAGAQLREQTKQLVAAAAEALKNKDSDDARKRLEDLMAGAKKQADELAERQQREAERRAMLLKASAGLGVAIDKMQGNLSSYREALKHEVTPALENDMEREERERLAKLKK